MPTVPEWTADGSRTVPVDRLEPGDHSCMAFTDSRSQWQVLTAYTRTSLARKEKVLLGRDRPEDRTWVLEPGVHGRLVVDYEAPWRRCSPTAGSPRSAGTTGPGSATSCSPPWTGSTRYGS
ncbi:hypothetical protein [Actinacidiphila oryziradicis]|uniref:hypothetical protein n=1 Tax=Actinacidiphila oryziradicis TaxID=2571141 RepID=UPI001FEA42C0|nr:hypothetical protein [Actinacidiphila oryziradicis]